jgi:hypothetical protein
VTLSQECDNVSARLDAALAAAQTALREVVGGGSAVEPAATRQRIENSTSDAPAMPAAAEPRVRRNRQHAQTFPPFFSRFLSFFC